MEYIRTEQLKKKFRRFDENGEEAGSTYALTGVDMTVEAGSFVAILGRNGSGKSTLAKHFNALLTPSEGSVYIEGLDTKDDKNVRAIRSGTGMVFQNPDNQMVSSIIEEDVAFGPENLGVESREIARRIDESLKRVNMSAYIHHAPNRLSGGQKQRIAIAGVLAMRPKCIILDEATSMLDPQGRADIMDTVRELNAAGITMIMITHFMEEAAHADKVFVMDGGRVIMSGTPREIFARRDEVMAAGLRLPMVSELACRLKEEGIDIELPILTEEELTAAVLQAVD